MTTEQKIKILLSNLDQIRSPYDSIRKPAEEYLQSLEAEPGYAILILEILKMVEITLYTLLAASILFKNYIKKYWCWEEQTTDRITKKERNTIKDVVVALMLNSNESVQRQISDTISIIGKSDFPWEWPNLLPQLVEKFNSKDFNAINGVLQTSHSLFKKYRYEMKSQKLWEEIKFVSDNYAKPFIETFDAVLTLLDTNKDNIQVLKVLCDSIFIMMKIFHSLNYQDLLQPFEDSINLWMDSFHKLLQMTNSSLEGDSEREAGPLELIKSQICDNLALLAQKYDEDFKDYLPNFVQTIWNLLVTTNLKPKHDLLMSNAIDFLAHVAEKTVYSNLFQDKATLDKICSNIILPNIQLRDADEELFEDNPEEYIRQDLEGSDVDTRRHAACHLIKALCKHFEKEVIDIFSNSISEMLGHYAVDPGKHWMYKDAALFLIVSIASKGKTERYGITKISGFVDITEIYTAQVSSELKSPQINQYPMLKATVIKYILHFRSLLSKHILMDALPNVVTFLGAQSKVVNTYAASCCEKLLYTVGTTPDSIQVNDLLPYATPMISNLITLLNTPGSEENEYAMKCMLRVVSKMGKDFVPFVEMIMSHLFDILKRVSKNPCKPHFNHFLFETLGCIIKNTCTQHPSATESFEQSLFPLIEDIMVRDVAEFIPYVFQLLSLMLELRGADMPEPYMVIYPHLLSPVLWEKTGNVPALSRLLQTYIEKCSRLVCAEDKFPAVLGVFQKLIASKVNDQEGFAVLVCLLNVNGAEFLLKYLRDIIFLLFQRLQMSKTVFYCRGLTICLSALAARMGAVALVELIDSIQPQLFGMVLEKVIVEELSAVTSREDERRLCVVGVTKILTEVPAMLKAELYLKHWYPLLHALIQLIEAQLTKQDKSTPSVDFSGDNTGPLEEMGYQASFSKLLYAEKIRKDFFLEIAPDYRVYLAKEIKACYDKNPDVMKKIIEGPDLSDADKQKLHEYLQFAGVRFN